MEERTVCEALAAEGFALRLRGFSAIDRCLGRADLPFLQAETDAGLPCLARLFGELRFPGPALADAALDLEEGAWYFRCIDPDSPPEPGNPPFALLSFALDLRTGRFLDPRGVYPALRRFRRDRGPSRRPGASPPPGARFRQGGDGPAGEPDPAAWQDGLNPRAEWSRAVMAAALILARYGGPGEGPGAEDFQGLRRGPPPGPEEQRLFLTGLCLSDRPEAGLKLLKASGFLEELWPELDQLEGVDHSKEFHPEGNGWNHTLETFQYRKVPDLRLSLGLLLHDVGKSRAAAAGSRRFDGHAELGAGIARTFLERLGFGPSLVADVFYLVKNHMLPAALPRLPLGRTEAIMASPLFPTLMELYRCDESSSFKGLDGYYESSSAYRAYLKHRRNPYRSADGKKLV